MPRVLVLGDNIHARRKTIIYMRWIILLLFFLNNYGILFSQDSLFVGAGEGDLITSTPSGVMYKKGHYVNGKLNGPLIYYGANGRPFRIYNFKDGVEDGESISYYQNGNIKTLGHWKNGVNHGSLVGYFRNGKIYMSGQSDMGRRFGVFVLRDRFWGKIREWEFGDHDNRIEIRRYIWGILLYRIKKGKRLAMPEPPSFGADIKGNIQQE